MTRPILNIADLQLHPWGQGDRYEARIGAIGGLIGAQKLGYNLTRITPELAQYPDSGKFGVLGEVPGPDGKPRQMRFIMKAQATPEDYWEGE